MSFILSCDFWFCCGGSSASDDPPDRYHHHQQPPPPSSQTQMVAVVQQAPPPPQPAAQQPCHHHHQMMMAPHLVAPPLAPPAAAAPPQPPATTTPWPHIPRTPATSYADPPHPVMRQPLSSPAPPAAAATTTILYHDLPPVSPQTALPPRRVPSNSSHHDLFLPATPTPSPVPQPSTKAPWPLARQPSSRAAVGATQQTADVPPSKVRSNKRYDETPATQTPPRARETSSVVHRDPSAPSSTQTRVAASMEMKASMKMKAAYNGEPQTQQPAPAVTSSQRRPPQPQASWPTRQPSKTYQKTQPGPRQVSYNDDPVPAVVEDDLSHNNQQASSEPLNHYLFN